MRHLLALLGLILVASTAGAQETATLVADRVEIRADNALVAEGSVEVLHKGVRLKASRIVFDKATNTLQIDGPIVLTDASGSRVLADQAQLSSDLADGILTGARLVLDQQLQLAAADILRVGGRYTQLGRTVASSCQVCAANPVPLWEIRARRVVHDQLEQQIYFENAQLRFAGVPVFYLPRLRMPDPTLKRANGFLTPSIRSTSQLGPGLIVPYFLTFGPNRDLTLAPYVSTNDMQTLNFRYRQAFANGNVELNGAVTSDQILPGETRGYLFVDGSFALRNDFDLTFGIETASDNSYLLDYGISTQDRLDSFIALERVRRDEYVLASATNTSSQRDNDDNSSLPSTIVNLIWTDRFSPPVLGGLATVSYGAVLRGRSSTSTEDSDGDGTSDGQDTARALVTLDWRRDWVLPMGVVGATTAKLQGDVTHVGQDPAFPDMIFRPYGVVGGELRWPLLKTEASGATQVLEPVAQFLISQTSSPDVPDDDSFVVELDEGNLLSLNRFPGTDEIELGTRGAIGLNWTRYGTDGSTIGLAFGRVYRAEDLDQFTPTSGLDGTASDWLIGANVVAWNGLSLTQRALLNDDFSSDMAETRLVWIGQDITLGSGYYWGQSDPEADRPDDISEVSFNGTWQISGNWKGRLGVRHDFIAGRTSNADLGLEFRNECILVDLSLSRWYADSTSVTPTTEFGFAVDLLGFGGSSAPGPARRCRS